MRALRDSTIFLGERARATEPRLERETGIEPATNSLEGCDSTTELLPPTRSLTSPHRAPAAWPASHALARYTHTRPGSSPASRALAICLSDPRSIDLTWPVGHSVPARPPPTRVCQNIVRAGGPGGQDYRYGVSRARIVVRAGLPAVARGRRAPESEGWWRGEDSNLRRPEPTDLQSAAFDRFATSPHVECRPPWPAALPRLSADARFGC